jgi:hypothetical protein
MSNLAEAFNRSSFSRFINSPAGRIFRFVAGIAFFVIGFLYRYYWLGIVSLAWGILPFTAGAFDICYISRVLGGPLSGRKIRDKYHQGEHAQGAP